MSIWVVRLWLPINTSTNQLGNCLVGNYQLEGPQTGWPISSYIRSSRQLTPSRPVLDFGNVDTLGRHCRYPVAMFEGIEKAM